MTLRRCFRFIRSIRVELGDRSQRHTVMRVRSCMLTAGLLVTLTASGCGTDTPRGRPLYEYPGVVNAEVSAISSYRQGLPWTRGREAVQPSEVSAVAGSARCGWSTAVLLRVSNRHGPPVQYVRDPDGAISRSLSRGWERRAHLPASARPTGYLTRGSIELWLTPEQSAAYLVSSTDHSDAERWPASVPPVSCPR